MDGLAQSCRSISRLLRTASLTWWTSPGASGTTCTMTRISTASASALKKEQRLLMSPNSPKPEASRRPRDDRDFAETSILWHAQRRGKAVERGRANNALFSKVQSNAGIVASMVTVHLNVQIADSAMAGIGSHGRGTHAARKGRPVGATEIGTSSLTDGTIHGLLQVPPHHPAGHLRHRRSLDVIKLPNRQLLGHLESSRRSTPKWMECHIPSERMLTGRLSSSPGRLH